MFSIIRSHVTKKGFVVMDADLSPDRKLVGTHDEGLATYRELVRNLSTAAHPEGGALPLVLDKWINELLFEAKAKGFVDAELDKEMEQQIYSRCADIRQLVHGMNLQVCYLLIIGRIGMEMMTLGTRCFVGFGENTNIGGTQKLIWAFRW